MEERKCRGKKKGKKVKEGRGNTGEKKKKGNVTKGVKRREKGRGKKGTWT